MMMCIVLAIFAVALYWIFKPLLPKVWEKVKGIFGKSAE